MVCVLVVCLKDSTITQMGSKYKNVRVKVNGKTCDSKAEGRDYSKLLLAEKAGEITNLKLHPRYPIYINGILICTVVLDFEYFDKKADKTFYVDRKGFYTDLSKLKHKLFEATYEKKVEIWSK